MLKIFVLALLFVAVSANSVPRHRYQLNQAKYQSDRESRRGRIVGGRESTIQEFPYQVGLFYDFRHYCGGSILNENTILSVAHCTYDYNHANYQILAGQTDITRTSSLVSALWVAEHPEYDDWELLNDIVVLRLERSLVFSDSISAKFLPVPNFNVPAGSRAVVSGWGDLEYNANNYPDILHSVEVPVLSNAECQRIYDEEEIFSQHICAGEVGRSACSGDSGGPLVYNNIQVGIVSWGYGCALDWPIVYVRVSEFLGFITQQMNRP